MSGVEINNHEHNKTIKVPNGTAADELFDQKIKFVIKNTANKMLKKKKSFKFYIIKK